MNHRRTTSEPAQPRFLPLRTLTSGLALAAAVMGLSSESAAQAFPFPSSNIPAANGSTTTVLTSHELENLYQFWKTNFLQTCGTAIRVRYPETNNDTRSEGVGYGMVIAAYMGDQPTFNGLRDFYNRFANGRNGTPAGLMVWKTNNCDASGDTGSAADADIDAALGLIVADKQWPGQGYGGQATTLLTAIQNQLFQGACQGILLAGSTFASCNCTNPSYSAPGYYRAFAQYGNAGFWNTARTNTYTYLAASQNDTTGLVPAWSSSNGGGVQGACNPQVSGGGQTNQFQADAARTPWRVATDLLWSGNPAARTFLTPMANFISGGQNRIVQIVDNYSLQGQPQTANGAAGLNAATLDATGRRSTFTMGGFATAMAASSQANIDAFTAAWQSMYLPGDSVDGVHAFNTSLALLYGLLVTGFMWDPIGPAPTPRPEPALNPQAGNLLDNGDFDEGILGWTTENFGAGASEGYTMHKNGEVTFQIQENQAAEPWNLPFYQTVPVTQGQKYLISFRARASAPRQLRVTVAQVLTPFTTYGEIIDRVNAEQLVPGIPGSGVPLTTEMQQFETVFTATGNDQAARFAFQVGQSNASVTIDDVVFSVTDRPVSFRGELGEGGPDPVGGQGGAGGAGPGPGGPGTAGTTGAPPVGTIPGEQNPGGAGAGPGAPMGAPVGAPSVPGSAPGAVPGGTPRNAENCRPYAYSDVLKLCYDETTGYVFDDSKGIWTQPPVTDACRPYVYWPKIRGCYDPDTGYGCEPTNCNSPDDWQYFGTDYTFDTKSDSGTCALVDAPRVGEGTSAWIWLLGFAGAAGWRCARARRRAG